MRVKQQTKGQNSSFLFTAYPAKAHTLIPELTVPPTIAVETAQSAQVGIQRL